MTVDFYLGPDAQANHALAVLRAMSFDRDLVPRRPREPQESLVPGIFLSWDPEGDIRAHGKSRPGSLLDLNLTVARPGRWLALHVALGPVDLTGIQAVGLICRSVSPHATTFQPCLRSGLTEGGFTDQFFRKRVLAHSEPGLYLDALLPGMDNLPRTAPWRELVLFLRPETGRIDLQDLRLFII